MFISRKKFNELKQDIANEAYDHGFADGKADGMKIGQQAGFTLGQITGILKAAQKAETLTEIAKDEPEFKQARFIPILNVPQREDIKI